MIDKKYNSIFKYLAVIIGIFIFAIMIVIIYYYMNVFYNGELSKKTPYAVLQGIEISHRNDKDAITPIVVRNILNSGYDVLGIPSYDKKFPRTWIILNKVAADDVIFMVPPTMRSHVNCQEIINLHLEEISDPKVFRFLMNSCI